MRAVRAFAVSVWVLSATWACGDDDGASTPEKVCFEGAEGCPCDDGECRRGLVCLSNRCVARDDGAAGASDGGSMSRGGASQSGASGSSEPGEPGGGETNPGSSGGRAPAGGTSSGGVTASGGRASGGTSSNGGAPADGGARDGGSGGEPSGRGGSTTGGAGGASGGGSFGTEPVFFDDFEDGDVAGWSFSHARWLNVEHEGNRVFTQDLAGGEAAGVARIGDTSWTDQWADVRFKFASDGDPLQSYVFVGVRYEDGYNSAYVQLYRSGVALLGEMYESAPNTVTQNVIEFTHDLDLDAWHTLGIKAEGNRVTAFIDGTPRSSYAITARTSGNVALGTTITYTSVYFDDVSVFVPE